jgi:hypothetical protein
MTRPFALMMPTVTVQPRPKGLPIARPPPADALPIGIAQRHHGQLVGHIDLDQCHVRLRIPADELGIEPSRSDSATLMSVAFSIK